MTQIACQVGTLCMEVTGGWTTKRERAPSPKR